MDQWLITVLRRRDGARPTLPAAATEVLEPFRLEIVFDRNGRRSTALRLASDLQDPTWFTAWLEGELLPVDGLLEHRGKWCRDAEARDASGNAVSYDDDMAVAWDNGVRMAKKRPSVQKRQREYEKRQCEMDKAAKAAQNRERRQNRAEASDSPPTDCGSSSEAERTGDDE